MSKLEGLGKRIAREQDVQRASLEGARADVRARLADYDPSAAVRARRLRYVSGAGALLAAAAAAVLWLGAGAREAKLELRVGTAKNPVLPGAWVEAPPQASAGSQELRLNFSDGTRLDMAPRTRMRVIELDEHGAHLLLESGALQLAVVPRAHASWRLSVGPFSVRVVGTRFDVRWNPDEDAFGLALTHGEVALSGCVFGSDYRVGVGQAVDASCRRGILQLRKLSDPPAALAAPEPATAAAPEHEAAVEAPKATPAATPATPTRPKEPRSTPRTDARSDAPVDDASQEEQELLLIRRRHAGSSRAAVAAFGLGRLEFDKRHAYAKAAQWFGTYLKEEPSGSLAREARGRLMEATLAAGDRARARALADEYLSLHPTGPHAVLARSLGEAPWR
jgi:transmembrane sensor